LFVSFYRIWKVYFWITPKSRRHVPRPFSFVLISVLTSPLLIFAFFAGGGGESGGSEVKGA